MTRTHGLAENGRTFCGHATFGMRIDEAHPTCLKCQEAIGTRARLDALTPALPPAPVVAEATREAYRAWLASMGETDGPSLLGVMRDEAE